MIRSVRAALLLTLCGLLGCAGTAKPRPGGPVEASGSVFVALPAIPASLDSALAAKGWGDSRFAGELRKEIRFQFNRAGVQSPEDSAVAKGSLSLEVSDYAPAGACAGAAVLRTGAGERKIAFRHEAPKEAGPARDDPTVDDIRAMAEKLVAAARKDPAKAKRNGEAEYNPTLLMLF